MKIRNINPAGAVYVAALDMRLVGAGEVVDVDQAAAAVLLIQTANWELAEDGRSKAADAAREFAERVIADEAAHLVETSSTSHLLEAPGAETETPVQTETPGEGEPA